MPSSDSALLADVRVQTGYSSSTLSDTEMESVLSNSRRHIRTQLSVVQEWTDAEWYDTEEREEALFWWTCLFALVAAGELDRSTIAVGGIDVDTLLSDEDGEVVLWLRNARNAMRALTSDPDAKAAYGITRVNRESIDYQDERPQRREQGNT